MEEIIEKPKKVKTKTKGAVITEYLLQHGKATVVELEDLNVVRLSATLYSLVRTGVLVKETTDGNVFYSLK